MTDSHMSRRGPTLSRILSHRATEQCEKPAHITLNREPIDEVEMADRADDQLYASWTRRSIEGNFEAVATS